MASATQASGTFTPESTVGDLLAHPAFRGCTAGRRAQAMRRAGIPVERHTYPRLGHGFGLGLGTEVEGWHNQAIRFWEAQLPPQTKRNN